MELSNFEIWEKWLMLLIAMVIPFFVIFRKDKKQIDQFYSQQVDEMWRKIDAGLEVRPSKYLR